MDTVYYRRADGGLVEGVNVVVPSGATVLTAAQYATELAALDAANAASAAAIVAAECVAKKAAYNDLIATTGMAPATASLLTGWNPGDC